MTTEVIVKTEFDAMQLESMLHKNARLVGMDYNKTPGSIVVSLLHEDPRSKRTGQLTKELVVLPMESEYGNVSGLQEFTRLTALKIEKELNTHSPSEMANALVEVERSLAKQRIEALEGVKEQLESIIDQ